MSAVAAPARLRVGVVKYASCDGCQLTLLDLEDELLDVADRFEIVEFPEASSSRSSGPYDVLLVEGSISTPDQAREIVELRAKAKTLVTIGACASSGGIQALRNWADHDAFRAAVYAHPEYIESLATATPVRDHVDVDLELRGCPINPDQLRELLASLVLGRRPQIRDEAVCLECKRKGNVCVLVATGTPCLGPVTQTGCGALCPSYSARLLRLLRPEGAGERERPRRQLPHRPPARGGRPALRRLHRLRGTVPHDRLDLGGIRIDPDGPGPGSARERDGGTN